MGSVSLVLMRGEWEPGTCLGSPNKPVAELGARTVKNNGDEYPGCQVCFSDGFGLVSSFFGGLETGLEPRRCFCSADGIGVTILRSHPWDCVPLERGLFPSGYLYLDMGKIAELRGKRGRQFFSMMMPHPSFILFLFLGEILVSLLLGCWLVERIYIGFGYRQGLCKNLHSIIS